MDGGVQFNAERVEQYDYFSGKGAYLAYKHLCAMGIKWDLNIETVAQELLFHSTFGTYVEDVGILAYMTRHTGWSRRSEIS